MTTNPTFREAIRTWAKIGFLSFGGPAGQIAILHRIVVDEKRWVREPQFLHALNFCMLLPGPEAQQLATYIGWLLHGTRGGLAAGLLFIVPGFLVIVGLAAIYAAWRDVTWVAGVFLGLQPAVLALVVHAVVRVGKRALKTRFLMGLSAASFCALFLFHLPFPVIVLGAGVVGSLAGRVDPNWIAKTSTGDQDEILLCTQPTWRRTALVLCTFALLWGAPIVGLVSTLGREHVYSRAAIFFSKMAVVTFGGAYAVLAYVAQQAVQQFGWLTAPEMVDGLGLAETTPGPLILVLTFVGYLAGFRESGVEPAWMGGLLGAVITTWVTFVPCFLWILLGAPYVERIRHVRFLNHGLAAITAAVVGVILNLAIWFSMHVLFDRVDIRHFGGLTWEIPVWSSVDPAAAGLSAVALIALLRFHLGLVWLLGAAAIVGIATALLA